MRRVAGLLVALCTQLLGCSRGGPTYSLSDGLYDMRTENTRGRAGIQVGQVEVKNYPGGKVRIVPKSDPPPPRQAPNNWNSPIEVPKDDPTPPIEAPIKRNIFRWECTTSQRGQRVTIRQEGMLTENDKMSGTFTFSNDSEGVFLESTFTMIKHSED